MPAKIPYKKTHAQIQKRIQAGVPMDATHWQSKHSLLRPYERIHRDKVNDVIFRGHGGWYAYLRAEHGITSLTAPEGTYPEKDVHMLKQVIESGTRIDIDIWAKENPELINLFYRLKRRRKQAEIFGGHGSFAKFLAANQELKLAMSGRIREAIRKNRATQTGTPIEVKQASKEARISSETLLDFIRAAPETAIVLRNLRPGQYSIIFETRDLAQAIRTVEKEIRRADHSRNKKSANEKISRLNKVLEKLYTGKRDLGVIECGSEKKK